jgi:succinoglycan biosynthesis protein ExoM
MEPTRRDVGASTPAGISFAVVTYDRHDDFFDRFLESLYCVVSADFAPTELIFINNDAPEFEARLREKVLDARDQWSSRTRLSDESGDFSRRQGSVVTFPEFVFKTSPEKNLAIARNHALDYARFPFVAFMDDDQHVKDDWLFHLFSCLERYKADVVAGPVFCDFPSNAPHWLRHTDIHNTLGKETGDQLYTITAGNCLLSRDSIEGMRFDPSFGRSGGEDTELFKRLQLSGKEIRWCAEAVATEWVGPDRACASYAVRRFVAQGQSYRRMELSQAGWIESLFFFARALVQGLVSGVVALVLVVLARRSAGDWVKRCFNNFGKLALGRRDEYS